MPDGKRWYPLGSPEWWTEFGKREARGWADIGKATWDIFDPRTPIFPERYPTERYPTGERVQRFQQAKPGEPLAPSLRGFRPSTVPYTGFSQAFDIGETRGVGAPDKNTIISQILLMAKALGYTPEDLLNTYGGGMYLSWDEVPMDDVMGMPGLISIASRISEETQGLGEDVYSRQGRQRLAEAVGMGALTQEQAFGGGSMWERWQHEQADEFNQAYSQSQFPAAFQQLQSQYPNIDLSSIKGQLAQSIKGNWWSDEVLGAVLSPLLRQVGVRQLAQAKAKSFRAAANYPKWFEKYAPQVAFSERERVFSPSGLAGEAEYGLDWGQPQSAMVGGGAEPSKEETFLGWAMGQPGFKEEMLQRETQRRQEYPQLARWYEESGSPESFKGWYEKDPLALAVVREKERVKAIPTRKKIPKWAGV